MRKIVAGVVVGLLLLVVGGVLLVALNLDPLINEQRDKIAAVAAEQLGRQVSFGPVDTSWKGGLGAVLTDIKLAGRDPSSPPQVSVERITFKVHLWRAIFSLGKHLEITEFRLVRPVIRASRNKEGIWDFQDILDHLERNKPDIPPPEETVEEMKDPERFKGLRIAGLAIEDARVELDDGMLDRKLAVEKLNLKVSEIIPGQNVTAVLDLALNDGKSAAPFHLDATVRPLPVDLNFDNPPATHARVTLGELDLEPWGSLLPQGAIAPAEGRLSIDLVADANTGAEKATAKGFIDLKKLVLAKGKVKGQQSDIRVDLDIDANVKAKSFEVRQLDVVAPALKLDTRVSVNEPTVAGIRNADIALRVTNLERVVAILPAGSGLLPPELTLEGPIDVSVKGDASAGALKVNLDAAHLAWADAMNKAAGTPLHLTVNASRAGDRVKLPAIELVLDNAKLNGTADLSTKKGGPIDAELDTGPIVLANMRGIFPPFAKAIQAGQKVDGTLRLEAHAKAQGEKQELHAALTLAGMDVNLQSTRVRGNGLIKTDVLPAGGTTTATLDADLTGLNVEQINLEKKETVVEKPMGFPTGIQVKVVHTGPEATVEQADIKLGTTLVQARGKATRLDTKSPALDVKVEKLDIAFDDVRVISNAARVLPAGGHLTARIDVTGNPDAMKSMKINVADLKLLAAKNTVAGNISVVNLDDPLLDVKLDTVDLNFDELRKLAKNESIPAGGYLKAKVLVNGNTNRLSTMSIAVEDLDTSVYRSRFNGFARIKNLDAPDFDIKLHGDKLDVNTILASTSGGKEEPKKEEPKKKPENERGLPKETRETLRKVNGKADLALGQVLYDKYVFNNFVGQMTMKNGVITFQKLSLATFDGTVDASGTSIDAGQEWLQSALKLDVKNLDAGQIVDSQSDKRKGSVTGRISANLDVRAKGMGGDDVLNTMEGPVTLESKSMTVNGMNLLASLNGPIAKVVPIANQLKGKDVDPNGPTQLQDVKGQGRFEGGKMILTHPMTSRTPYGDLALEGFVRFDSRLNLIGSAELSPDVIARMTGGKYRPKNSVKTPVKIGGTWHKPVVEGVDVSAFLKGAGLEDVAGAAKAVAEEASKRLEEQAANAKAEAERVRKEAEDRAKAQAAAAAEEARKKADEARKQAEDALKKQADAAKAAQEDAKRKADDARKKAEDDARKRAEDARKKAEDEARKRAEAEKKKAEDKLKGLFK